MKKTKEEAALTRQALLDAALKTFCKKGYSGTSLETVAKEAGMTRGAIYWHFKNKFQLLTAVIMMAYEKAKVRVDRVLQSPQGPLQKIRRLLRELFLIVAEEKEFKVIEEVLLFKVEKKKELKRLYDEHMEKVKEMKEILKRLVEEGIAAGEFDDGIAPDTVVVAMLSYVGGIKTAWLSDRTSFSTKENAQNLADIFINGIAKK
jgi:TetR/AcrR family acrAB operon transcriptional repressor